MTEKEKFEKQIFFAYITTTVDAEKYEEQVKNGKLSQEWLDGYMRGLDDFRESLNSDFIVL